MSELVRRSVKVSQVYPRRDRCAMGYFGWVDGDENGGEVRKNRSSCR